MVAEKDGETIAIAITLIDVNQVLKKMKGRLLPLGWWHFLNATGSPTGCGSASSASSPSTSTPASPRSLRRTLRRRGEDAAEKRRGRLHPRDQRGDEPGLEAMNGRVVKRYRVYRRAL